MNKLNFFIRISPLTIVLFFSCKNVTSQSESPKINELLNLCKKEIRGSYNHHIDFRNGGDQIDWNWYDNKKLDPIPENIMTEYFGQTYELKKWENYQICYCEYFHLFQDSIYHVIVSNQVLNNNEANKYLIVLNHHYDLLKVILLAKIEKSIDDLFEVRTFINDKVLEQIHIHSYIEEDNLIRDSVIYKFMTNDYIYYYEVSKDSVIIF